MTRSEIIKNAVTRFFEDLASFAADVLALSLFDNSANLLVHFNHQQSGRHVDATQRSQLRTAIGIILQRGVRQSIGISHLLDWALSLIGHDVHDDLQKAGWVISNFYGQVVYPKLYETQSLQKRGFLTLSWAPGQLFYNGNIYKRGGFGGIYPYIDYALPITAPESGVNGPVNLFPS